MKLEFHGKVNENGTLHIINRGEFDQCIAASFSGKEVTIWIDRKTRRRSNPQNRFYHGCLIPIIRNALRDLGHRVDNEDVHEFLKNKFLKGTPIGDKDGVEMGVIRRSTASLTTSEFMDYIAEIREWSSAILDTIIPEPGEQLKITA